MPDPVGTQRLDGPPPPAQGVVRRVPPDPGMGAMLGLPGVPPTANAEMLIGMAMEQEIKLRELAVLFPELAPLAAQFVDALRAAAQTRISSSGQPQPAAPVNPMQSAMGGPMAAQPAGLGAGAPPTMAM